MKRNMDEAFMEIAKPILEHPQYQILKDFIQHGSVTTYEHSLNVAYIAYRLNHKLHIHADDTELIQAALLHDFYLYDWHEHDDHLHGYHHPHIAAKHARNHFAVNDNVYRAIQTHMWPLTLFHVPNSKIGWLITTADKISSLHETLFER